MSSELRQQNLARLDLWRSDVQGCVAELATLLGLGDLSGDPLPLVPHLERALRDEDLAGWDAEQRRRWWIYLMGAVSAVVLHLNGGHWDVEQRAGHPAHGRYVLTGFPGAPDTAVDLAPLVMEFLASPPRRSFVALLAAAESDLPRGRAGGSAP
jgi:hypothetical protein